MDTNQIIPTLDECELCENKLRNGRNTVLVEHRLYHACNDCQEELRQINSDPSHIFTLQEVQAIAK